MRAGDSTGNTLQNAAAPFEDKATNDETSLQAMATRSEEEISVKCIDHTKQFYTRHVNSHFRSAIQEKSQQYLGQNLISSTKLNPIFVDQSLLGFGKIRPAASAVSVKPSA